MNYAILLSGGTGTRTGSEIPKQYVRVSGHMMVTLALSVLMSSEHIDKVVIVADEVWQDMIIKDAEDTGLSTGKIMGFADPGDTRQLSIYNAITYIIEISKQNDRSTGSMVYAGSNSETCGIAMDDTVLVHDAARPYITEKIISDCYEAISGNDGVMPVLPMKDTVYLSENGKTVSDLLDRRMVYAGQAPELFRLLSYYEANKKLMPTDIYKINGASEPAVMAGMKIAMIPGDEKNVKVTTAGDMDSYISKVNLKAAIKLDKFMEDRV